MGLFDNEAERQRKQSLRELEDKRLAFAQRLQEMGLRSDKSLYGQVEGGFHGVALSGEEILYITGPGPGSAEDYTVARHPSAVVRSEEIFIKSEGLGGVLGFGKKGGLGFRLVLTFPDGTQGDVEIVAGQNCVLAREKGADPVFSVKRRRGLSNVVWDFRPIEAKTAQALRLKWLELLGG